MEKTYAGSTVNQIIKRPRILIIDRYIIRKFLSTFFFSIALIMAIAIVFDFSEKIDDFIESTIQRKRKEANRPDLQS